MPRAQTLATHFRIWNRGHFGAFFERRERAFRPSDFRIYYGLLLLRDLRVPLLCLQSRVLSPLAVFSASVSDITTGREKQSILVAVKVDLTVCDTCGGAAGY